MTSSPQSKVHHGVKPLPLLISLLIAVIILFIPIPEGVNSKAWKLLSVFLGMLAALIGKALPMGAVAFVGLTSAFLIGALTVEEGLSGFGHPIAWLVVIAFFIAKGFAKTGLGLRIAYLFVGIFGKKSLGLGYGIALSDLLLAPVIPSNTARAGGIVYPIIKALAHNFGSTPDKKTERKIGSFLVKVGYQVNMVTGAMFLTAMTANPLMVDMAKGLGINITWGSWMLAALVPGLLSFLLIPLIIYKLYPPEIKKTPEASQLAWRELETMGPLSKSEWIMLGTLSLALFLWIFGDPLFGIGATATAAVALSLLLLTGVLTWNDILDEKEAWSTLIWFSTIITMASYLNKLGLIGWFATQVQQQMSHLEWHEAFPLLVLLYFYSHYFFAGNTAHASSMFAPFLGAGIQLGTPPMLMALALCFCSSLFAGLTHYGTGAAPILFGSGYVDVKTWWKLGFLISLLNLTLWILGGSLWWKVLGYW